MSPILYTFRRCPFAIRARLALNASGIMIEMREIELRSKPDCMLAVSPKGSVPVLVLPDGRVIDESWDIMLWALRQEDPDDWLGYNEAYAEAATPLIAENDSSFKHALDRYKYSDRYPEQSQLIYRSRAEKFLRDLECRLCNSRFLLSDAISIADAGVLPFIRQFAEVDKSWFAQAPYPYLRQWLNFFTGLKQFGDVMAKLSPWQPGDSPVYMPHKKNFQ
jgi:glutathione S-transferase